MLFVQNSDKTNTYVVSTKLASLNEFVLSGRINLTSRTQCGIYRNKPSNVAQSETLREF